MMLQYMLILETGYSWLKVWPQIYQEILCVSFVKKLQRKCKNKLILKYALFIGGSIEFSAGI